MDDEIHTNHDVFVVEFVEKVGEAVVLVEEEELAVPASFPGRKSIVCH